MKNSDKTHYPGSGYYDIRLFTRRYLLLGGVFLLPVFCISLWCGGHSFFKTVLPILVYLLFATCAYLLFRNIYARTLREIDAISHTMIEVLEGKDDHTAEPYLEGSLGVLYTNFYKMVGSLRESQLKAKEEKEFLQATISDISHQLKTPLASLHVFVELLYEDKVTEPEKQKQILSEAQNQLDRMEWMVLSMLKLARIEAGVVLFEKENCSGTAIAKQAIESVHPLTEARRQTVRLLWKEQKEEKKEERDPVLYCDREWLTEALINLLKNASDYSAEGTEITITFEDNRLYTRVYVEDQGMGIPEEALSHIFERFYRVNHEVNPNSVGIGLSLTKSIVEGMGGRITVRSEVDRYTCFILTFMKP